MLDLPDSCVAVARLDYKKLKEGLLLVLNVVYGL